MKSGSLLWMTLSLKLSKDTETSTRHQCTLEDELLVNVPKGDKRMKIKYYFLLMGIVLAACSGASQTTPTPLPEPTDPPRPTATATEIPATETALPPPVNDN